MRKKIIFYMVFTICSICSLRVFAAEYGVVVSVSDYTVEQAKFDEISDPDIYFEIVYNGEAAETSKTVRDKNSNSYGDMKKFGDFCHGITGLTSEDKLKIKFYDLDYDTGIVKQFWEWVQGSLYKYSAYFAKQVELMNDPDKSYDDQDAYKAAQSDEEVKKAESELTNSVIEINKRRINKSVTEYIGEAEIDVKKLTEKIDAGEVLQVSTYDIVNDKKEKPIGTVNVVIKYFEGFGASLKVKGY